MLLGEGDAAGTHRITLVQESTRYAVRVGGTPPRRGQVQSC